MPHLFRIIVSVDDIEAAARFYGKILGFSGERISPGRHYFDCEGTILSCYDPYAEGDNNDTSSLSNPIYISVDDLEATYMRVKSAGAFLSDAEVPDVGPLGKIAKRPWGERSFYASDPFGNELCFVSRDSVFNSIMKDELKTLQQRHKEWIDIVNRGNAEVYAGLLTEDAVWFPPEGVRSKAELLSKSGFHLSSAVLTMTFPSPMNSSGYQETGLFQKANLPR